MEYFKKLRVLIPVVVIALILAAIFSFYGKEQEQKVEAQTAINEAIQALKQKNLEIFKSHVNIKKASEDFINKIFVTPTRDEKNINDKFIDFIKPELAFSLNKQIEKAVKTGVIENISDTQLSMLGKVYTELLGVSGTITLELVTPESKTMATATFNIERPDLNTNALLTLPIVKNNGTWQIESFGNILETLQELDLANYSKKLERNKAMGEKMLQTLKVVSGSKLHDTENTQDHIMLNLALENKNEQDITHLEIIIRFQTKKGDLMKIEKIHDETGILSGEILEKSWPILLDTTKEYDLWLKEVPSDELAIRVIPLEIGLKDGTVLRLEE